MLYLKLSSFTSNSVASRVILVDGETQFPYGIDKCVCKNAEMDESTGIVKAHFTALKLADYPGTRPLFKVNSTLEVVKEMDVYLTDVSSYVEAVAPVADGGEVTDPDVPTT